MFQAYAVTYKLEGHDKGMGTVAVIDLDEAAELVPTQGLEGARDLLLRYMIAVKRWGNINRENMVELTEVARLGGPTENPQV